MSIEGAYQDNISAALKQVAAAINNLAQGKEGCSHRWSKPFWPSEPSLISGYWQKCEKCNKWEQILT